MGKKNVDKKVKKEKKKKKAESKVVEPLKPSETALKATKEFSLCRDGGKKRSKEEGVSFFQEQLEQAILSKDDLAILRLTNIVNRLTGGKKNGLRIEPDKIRRKP